MRHYVNAGIVNGGHALSQALTACSWLPATDPLYRLALARARQLLANAGGKTTALGMRLGVTDRTARRLIVAFGLRTARQEAKRCA